MVITDIPSYHTLFLSASLTILGDPGAVTRVDKMSVVKVYCRDFKIRDYRRLDARSPMSGGLDRVRSVVRLVARKLKLSCYSTNYVLREIAAVEFTLKMSFQKVRDELIYCFADGILDEEEFVLLYDAYKSTNSIYPFWEYDEFRLTR